MCHSTILITYSKYVSTKVWKVPNRGSVPPQRIGACMYRPFDNLRPVTLYASLKQSLNFISVHFSLSCSQHQLPIHSPWNTTKLCKMKRQQIKRPPQKLLFPCVVTPVICETLFHLDCCKIAPEDKLSKKCNIPSDWDFECQSPLITTSSASPLPHMVPNIIQWKATIKKRKE